MKIQNAPAAKKQVVFTTKDNKAASKMAWKWWEAKDEKEAAQQLLASCAYLKENQADRIRRTSIFARMYGNQSLFSFAGSSKLDDTRALPSDRPTFNLVASAADTLVSRISQSRPSPVFLTDNGDYKERNLAKQLNSFILGEFYATKTYDKAVIMLRDALVTGTGVLKIYETDDQRVGVERKLLTEIFTDPNESLYGEPRTFYEVKLIDRDVLMALCPKYKATIKAAENAYPDNSAESAKTTADLVMVVESFHLPSSKNSNDGRHMLACSAGPLHDEEWTKDKAPYVFLHYSPRLLGFWAQGLAEQLLGVQMEINQLLYTISRAIRLVGVPRVFQEMGSKVVKAHNNNDVGVIIEYRGTKPTYEVAPCVPEEMYAQLQRLVDYGYQQCGVSALQASSQKPSGLNSGEAIRSYDDISTDRFNSLSRRYDNVFVDLAYLMTDKAKEIAERDGKYSTVFPNKDGTKEIDLPKASLLKDTFVIQAFNMSSLPRDPAGRMQKITEMVQSGMITLKEGRRLLDYPDLEQMEKLANASEERIFQVLDKIIEDGEYTPPDPFMDLGLAKDLTVQYYNLHVGRKLEEERAQMLRDFYQGVLDLMTAAMPPAPPPGAAPGGPPGANGQAPMAAPTPMPQSPLVPNGGIG